MAINRLDCVANLCVAQTLDLLSLAIFTLSSSDFVITPLSESEQESTLRTISAVAVLRVFEFTERV